MRTLILAVLMAGCIGATVWKQCELGQLPQISQTVIPTVVQDLGGVSQDNAIAQVEGVAGQLLPGQLSCIVKAIIADVEARSAQVKAALGPVQENIVRNGRAYLAKHPALACGEPPAEVHAAISSTLVGVALAGVPLRAL